jgi:SAM-dependent methyltransferase
MSSKTTNYRDYVESNISSYRAHQRQSLTQPPEMTKALVNLLKENIDTSASYRVLDIGCANGNTMYHLNQQWLHWQYTGIDFVEMLIEDGKEFLKDYPNIQLQVGDAHSVAEILQETFDITLLWRVLPCVQDWQRVLQSASRATRPGGYIIVSTLLNDSNIEAVVSAFDHSAEGKVKEATSRILSARQFQTYCEASLPIRSYASFPFELEIDLPKPPKGLDTYTAKMADGKRMQIAGGILIYTWKIVFMEMA